MICSSCEKEQDSVRASISLDDTANWSRCDYCRDNRIYSVSQMNAGLIFTCKRYRFATYVAFHTFITDSGSNYRMRKIWVEGVQFSLTEFLYSPFFNRNVLKSKLCSTVY